MGCCEILKVKLTQLVVGAQIEMNTIRPVKTMKHPFTKKYT